MDTTNLSAISGDSRCLHSTAGGQHSADLIRRTRGRSRKNGGRPVPGMRSTGGSDCGHSSIHEIRTGTSVTVNINETGRNIATTGIEHTSPTRYRHILASPDSHQFTVLNNDNSVWDKSIGKNQCSVD